MRKIYFPITVLEELVLVLKKLKVEEALIRKQIREIVSDPRVVLVDVEKKDVEEAISILEREKLSVRRFNDKIILVTARKMNLPLYTFDSELKEECRKFKIKIL